MTELHLSVDEQLAAQLTAEAAEHGLSVPDYVVAQLAARQEHGADEREQRALALSRVAYRRWNENGRPEEDAMSLDEVFG
ncbi:hypothetical protein [Streptomyces goshikiensis]|uniref:hypothetical protein n=1 Tax=Streptomyces goshikiensis TaxID=1942 RepID=UPI0036981516